jgi:hypothetical protein
MGKRLYFGFQNPSRFVQIKDTYHIKFSLQSPHDIDVNIYPAIKVQIDLIYLKLITAIFGFVIYLLYQQ